MTILMSLFPIVIIILIAAIISGVGRSVLQNAKFLNGKVIWFLLAGYGAILVISVIFSYTIPREASGTNSKKAQQIAEAFYANLNYGNLAEIEGVKVTDEWEFPFEGTVLDLRTVINENHAYVWVLVEKDEALTNEIRVSRYITPHVISDIEYTDLVVAPGLEINNETLSIIPPGRTNLKLSQFHKEFTITQFTGEKMFPGHDSTMSANLLYLRIPAQVKITTDEYVNLQYRGH
ncbi:hypothetical protein DS745_20445 [Anaerobacillus alkaliphilus]|uniref:Uncharacterized protein n=1 Tax=Anaerobacillus alkaliphilus TaxID=1548597 RepID=A0A4V1LG65_9BACI|nr:hypothetical protein [Anaerobacillus alkaliphilus]RXI98684.1 hypothetical protein DS745_20445 [Anaerobacillus alkaliphilus]